MANMKIIITDYWYDSLENEKRVIGEYGYTLEDYQCKNEDALVEIVKDADAIICQFAPITKKVIDSMEKCKAIIRYAIGVDNIDVAAATEKGIYVCNVPDYCIDEVSNHAIALLLTLIRKLQPMSWSVREGTWNYIIGKPMHRTAGSTLGFIGLGRIPALIVKKMQGFDMEMLCYDPYVDEDRARQVGVKLVDLETLLKKSDYITVNCPLNDKTRYMIDAKAFDMMKNTAIIINTARGGVICEKDLIDALQHGKIAAAGLDVTEKEPIDPSNPLLTMNNVIVTPHMAWYTEEAVQTLQRMVAEEAVRVLGGQRPKNPVNSI
ncbi:MAG: C-terminal binding protein [Bacillota bacterium]